MKISALAEALGMSRENVYDIFKRTDIPVHTLINAGKVLNHDFSEDFPDMFPHDQTEAASAVLPFKVKRLESELTVYKEKCFNLMEENRLLLAGRLEEYFKRFGALSA